MTDPDVNTNPNPPASAPTNPESPLWTREAPTAPPGLRGGPLPSHDPLGERHARAKKPLDKLGKDFFTPSPKSSLLASERLDPSDPSELPSEPLESPEPPEPSPYHLTRPKWVNRSEFLVIKTPTDLAPIPDPSPTLERALKSTIKKITATIDPYPDPRPAADTSGPGGSSLMGSLAPHRSRMLTPHKYSPDYCDKIKEVMGKGYSVAAFSGMIGVSPSTVYNWTKTIPEFTEAFEVAKALRSAILEEGLLGSTNMPQVTARIFTLKNANPEEFKDEVAIRQTHKLDASMTAEAVNEAIRNALAASSGSMMKQLEQVKSHAIGVIGGVEAVEGEFVEVSAGVETGAEAEMEGAAEDSSPPSPVPAAAP